MSIVLRNRYTGEKLKSTKYFSMNFSGDIVYVMEQCDDGWFVGTSQRTGIFGTFPGNYVTKV